MQDIAEKLNISKTSVFKALNNKLDISNDLKQRVIECAINLDYKYIDPLTKLSKHFYYIIPKQFMISTEIFYFSIFQELNTLLTSIGISIEIVEADSSFSVSSFHKNIATYHPDKIDSYGVFWAGIIPNEFVKSFLVFKIPIVLIDSYIKNSNGCFIYIDDYHAGFEITEYLIQKGHTNICAVIETKLPTNLDKFLGFIKALKHNNIEFKPEMHLNLSLAVMKNFKNFKLPNPLPTAFLFDSDYSANNFMMVMLSQGFVIPDDFSVVSFDNTKLGEETVPRLTSIGVSPAEIAESAYKIMLKRFSSKTIKPYMTILRSSIIERDSVLEIKK